MILTIYSPVLIYSTNDSLPPSMEGRGLTTEYFLDSAKRLPSLPTIDESMGFERPCCGIFIAMRWIKKTERP